MFLLISIASMIGVGSAFFVVRRKRKTTEATR